jgi:HD domain
VNRNARIVLAITLAISAAAAVVAALLADRSDPPRLGLWLGLLLAGAAMELMTIPGDADEAEHPFSLASSFHLAAAMLLPAGWAAIVAGGSTALGESMRRRAPIRVLFNTGVAFTATLAGSAAYHGVLSDGAERDFGWAMYPAVIVLLAAYVPIMISAVESISTAVSGDKLDFKSWIRPAELLAYLMEACLAVVLAVLITAAPEVLAFSVLLLAAVFLSIKHHRALKSETRLTLQALAATVDARDPYTAAHSERVSAMAARLAERLQLPTKQVLTTRWAGRLHDLGKVVVDNDILHKNGPLDDREWELMKSHPQVAADLLSHLSLTRDMLPGIRYHHERPDGRGYYHLGGDDLPIEAALIALADSYDAMTTDRPYRKALSTEEALRRIEDGLGTQFQPEVGKAFIAMVRGDEVLPLGAQDKTRQGSRFGKRAAERSA